MQKFLSFVAPAMILAAMTASCSSTLPEPKKLAVEEETPVFITIGQSNADGSAEFDPAEDARLARWYESPDSNPGTMHMWYHSTYTVNQPNGARWVEEGTVVDHAPGWLDLWYRNENTLGRTDMNIIHGYGSWSTGDGFDCAQGRRGMEGEFGMNFQKAFPGQEIYFVKLGCSGSSISTWTSDDGHNWDYFYEKMWKPAADSLLAMGKKPRLAGIWWMQGCSDRANDSAYYHTRLAEVVNNCRTKLGFPDAKVYIGLVVKPGESETNPEASTQFGEGVRAAQIAATTPGAPGAIENTVLIDTRDCPFQGDQLHFNHVGINRIGRRLAEKVVADGRDNWAPFTTPGEWKEAEDGSFSFVPYFGKPEITYGNTAEGRRAALLDYGRWSEIIEMP